MMLSKSATMMSQGLSVKCFRSTLASRRFLSQPALSVAMPGIEEPKIYQEASGEVQITTLPNGVRVISLDRNRAASAMGIFVDYGSRDEPAAFAGVTQFISAMAHQSTENRITPVRVIRDMAHAGSYVSSIATRETLAFTSESLREDAEEVFDITSDLLMNGKYHDWEVRDKKVTAEASLKDLGFDSPELMNDALHHAAYGNNGLGKPLNPSLASLNNVASRDTLTSWRNLLLNPERIVVSGTDISHASLVKMASEKMGSLSVPSEVITPRQRSTYVGGDVKHSILSSHNVNFTIAFEAPGTNDNDFAATCVLNVLMGGGGSFSAGGPGKGMYSRIYRNILSRYEYVESAECLVSLNSDSSLFGIQCLGPGEAGGHLVLQVAKELQSMATSLTQEEVDRAKKQLKSSVFINLESRSVLCEDMARHLLSYNKRISPEEVAKSIDELTLQSIQRVAKNIVATPVTMISCGDVREIPAYHQVSRMFQ